MWNAHETALLCQLLDSGGLSPLWAEVILLIFHTVTDIIRPDVKNDSDDMDIRQYVQFKKVPGGSRSECQILNGAVCTKDVVDRRNDFPLGAFLECCCFSPTYTCPYCECSVAMVDHSLSMILAVWKYSSDTLTPIWISQMLGQSSCGAGVRPVRR